MAPYNRSVRRKRKNAARIVALVVAGLDSIRALPKAEPGKIAVVGCDYDFAELRQRFSNALGVPRELLFPGAPEVSSAVKEKAFREAMEKRCLKTKISFITAN